MELVSVIVPFYNSENVMRNAIESCISQSYTNIEILLIDDGSADNSLNIAKAYADKDNRIFVYTKENGGPSAARNLGLQYAKGKYIQFLDSDDTLENNCIEKCIESFGKHPEASFLLFGFNIYSADVLLRKPNPGTGVYIPGDEYQKFIPIRDLMFSPCNKLYKRSYIKKLFDESRHYAEDAIFNYENLTENDSVAFIEDGLYNVQLNTDCSVNKRYKKGKIDDYLCSIELIERKLKAMFPQEFDCATYKAEKLSEFAYIINGMAKNASKSLYKEEIVKAMEVPYFRKLVNVKISVKAHNTLLFLLLRKKKYTLAKLYGKLIFHLYKMKKG